MLPAKSLPPSYKLSKEINLDKNSNIFYISVLSALMLFSIGAYYYFSALPALFLEYGLQIDFFELSRVLTLPWLVMAVISLFLHEGFHALFLAATTNEFPAFKWSLRFTMTYAEAWYLPKKLFLIPLAAPLLLLSGLYIFLMWSLPVEWLPGLLFLAWINLVNSVDDCLLIALTGLQAPGTMILQEAKRIRFYQETPPN